MVSFPGGGDTIEQKKRQAKELWETGCEEVDMVMNLTALKSQEFSYIKEELTAVREAIPTAILKVIIEAPHLTEAEIRQAVELCIEARADYAKTSTGWYPEYPSTVEQVRIMSEAAKGRIRDQSGRRRPHPRDDPGDAESRLQSFRPWNEVG